MEDLKLLHLNGNTLLIGKAFIITSGQELQQVNFPCRRITSVCFAGDNLDELYVTSGQLGLTDEELKEQPLAGSLFKVAGLGVKGKLMHPYKDK